MTQTYRHDIVTTDAAEVAEGARQRGIDSMNAWRNPDRRAADERDDADADPQAAEAAAYERSKAMLNAGRN